MVNDKELERFKILINCAEEYIKDNAGEILTIKRFMKDNKNLSEYNYKDLCKKLNNINGFGLIEGYKPDEEKEKWLERFLIHLQNYQAMPKAINYNENKDKITKAIDEYKKVLKNLY